MSPVLKISSSGSEPAAYMRSAIILMLRGELMTAPPPNHWVLRSSVQISGFSSTTCSVRISGVVSIVPGAALAGSSSLGMKRPPGPAVRLMTRSVSLRRMRCTTSR